MIKFCNKHGPFESKQMTLPIFASLTISCETMCPECEKEREREDEEEERIARERLRTRRLMAMGIEPEHFDAKLDNYVPENKSEELALQACRDIEKGVIKKLLLLGPNGVGKTHLGCALAIKFKGVRITAFELSARIRQGYNEGKTDIDVLDSLLKKPLIVLDEVGRSKGSESELNWMSYLIDKAHTRNIRLVIISNRELARNLPKEKKQDAIELFLGNDSISRLRQDSRIVEINGRDRRAIRAAV